MGILDRFIKRGLPVESSRRKPEASDGQLLVPDAVMTPEFADSVVAAVQRTGVADEIISHEISE